MSLLDTIRKNVAAAGQAGGTAPTGQTDRAARLLRQKATGKAGQQSTGPVASSIAEETAAAQTRQATSQIGQQGKLAAAGLGARSRGMQQRADIEQQELDRQRTAVEQGFQRQASKLAADLKRGKGEVDLNRDRAKLEQLGTTLALQDRQYISDLQMEGRKNRLFNEQNFDISLKKDIFADMQGLFADELDLQRFLNMDERAWQERMQSMELSDIEDMHGKLMQGQGEQLFWSSVGTGASAAAQYSANHPNTSQQPSTQASTPSSTSGTGKTAPYGSTPDRSI